MRRGSLAKKHAFVILVHVAAGEGTRSCEAAFLGVSQVSTALSKFKKHGGVASRLAGAARDAIPSEQAGTEQAGTFSPISQGQQEGREAKKLEEGASLSGTVFLTNMNVDNNEVSEQFVFPAADRL